MSGAIAFLILGTLALAVVFTPLIILGYNLLCALRESMDRRENP